MKVAIIGCGYSGLSAIRRCIEFGVDCTAFELSGQVGGLWVYTDEIGYDEFGVPIQTSLYESLRTNSPKQILELPDFEFKTKEDTSYPHHSEVRRYLEEFANHFNLLQYIKFHHYVSLISRSNGKWKIDVKNLKTNEIEINYFDAVMVCNGHTTKPFVPSIEGSQSFNGLQIHSRDYRRNTIFKNKSALIIGFGPSGLEIAHESSLIAKTTYVSLHDPCEFEHPVIISKPDVLKIKEKEVEFVDGSTVAIDVIVYCTGYEYDYPFLDSSCGISVEDGQIVQKLYKHYINIEHPSMCFVGLFQRVIVSYLFDLQVQAFLKFITKQIELPSKSAMLEWLNAENKRKEQLKIPKNRYYHLSVGIEEYFKDIATYAKLENIPPVLFKIFRHNERTYTENFYDLRRWYFKVLDDHNYTATLKPVSYS